MYNQAGHPPGPVPGTEQGPGLDPQPYQSQNFTFIVKITKERTWSDTIINQATMLNIDLDLVLNLGLNL